VNTSRFNLTAPLAVNQTSADTITIRGLELWTQLGVPDAERDRPQRVLATIELATSCASPTQTDDVSHALDYARVAAVVKQLAAARPRKLIETLAEDIAQSILREFHPEQVTVELQKFPFTDAQSVSVKITRKHHA
jgi:FolB domain-containing protein